MFKGLVDASSVRPGTVFDGLAGPIQPDAEGSSGGAFGGFCGPRTLLFVFVLLPQVLRLFGAKQWPQIGSSCSWVWVPCLCQFAYVAC